MKTRTAVIYYSATGSTYRLAEAIAEGAFESDGDVRVRKVRETAHNEAIASNEGWASHRQRTRHVPEASLEDLGWADVVILGTPARFGLPAAPLKQFIDSAGPLWGAGKLMNKVVSSFASAAHPHGGQETTLVALNNVFYHWGAIIVPPGYLDPIQIATGNPYGVSFAGENGAALPDETVLAAARHQGRRTVAIARLLLAGRSRVPDDR